MLSDFPTALEVGDWESIRRTPKADLHIHGFGGGDRAFLRERTGVDVVPLDRVLGSMTEMHAFVDRNLSALIAGPSGRALAIEATFVQARKDGVTCLEVGEDAWSITLRGGSAEAVWASLQDAHGAGAPDVNWIPQLGISRHCEIASIERWATPLLELRVFETWTSPGMKERNPLRRLCRSSVEPGQLVSD